MREYSSLLSRQMYFAVLFIDTAFEKQAISSVKTKFSITLLSFFLFRERKRIVFPKVRFID